MSWFGGVSTWLDLLAGRREPWRGTWLHRPCSQGNDPGVQMRGSLYQACHVHRPESGKYVPEEIQLHSDRPNKWGNMAGTCHKIHTSLYLSAREWGYVVVFYPMDGLN